MEDTTPQVKKILYKNLMERSEEDRFAMCADMFETSIELARVSMPANLNESEQRRFVFRAIYGEDLPPFEGE